MSDKVRQSFNLPVLPHDVYDAWLDAATHSEFTGKEVEIEKKVDSEFTFDHGYLFGKVKLMHLNKRIVESLRCAEFSEEDPDSQLEILFDENKVGGTKVTFLHTEIPDGEAKKYRKIIKDSYVIPMKEFFKSHQEAD